MSYASFSVYVEKIAAIAVVFPIFFVLVAALVSMTTMTRMVEEERGQIGTLKALGYSPFRIVSKYVTYSGLAASFGCVSGLFLGFYFLPRLFWNAYKVNYHLPALVTPFDWSFAAIAFAGSLACVIGATGFSCYRSLKEGPSSLMLAKAPPSGRRIFLERFGFLWRRLKFTYKATARNIVRNKKHFFMSVIGTAGCTALIIAGFSLQSSISSLTSKQFSELTKYDLIIRLDKESARNEIDKLLKAAEYAAQSGRLFSEVGYASLDKRVSAAIDVINDPASTGGLIVLRESDGGWTIPFERDMVLMSENLAIYLGLSPGEVFTLENSDGLVRTLTLTGVYENYIGSSLCLGGGAYRTAFGENPEDNTIFLQTSGIASQQEQDEITSAILNREGVVGAEFTEQVKTSFDGLLSSINSIVVVIIIAAGALAVIVLYNLTNININERRRELATLRVLGFHNKEVAAYIFRETMILSTTGALIGLGLGRALFLFIIRTIESYNLMFDHAVPAVSYIISFAVTIGFTLIVQFLLRRSLSALRMAESMKAAE